MNSSWYDGSMCQWHPPWAWRTVSPCSSTTRHGLCACLSSDLESTATGWPWRHATCGRVFAWWKALHSSECITVLGNSCAWIIRRSIVASFCTTTSIYPRASVRDVSTILKTQMGWRGGCQWWRWNSIVSYVTNIVSVWDYYLSFMWETRFVDLTDSVMHTYS